MSEQPASIDPSDWRILSDRYAYPIWSPDGSYALMMDGLKAGEGVTLITASGDRVRGYQSADFAVWLDDRQFLLITYGPGQGDRPNLGRTGTVDASGLEAVDLPSGQALGNGRGAVTFATISFDYAPDCDFGCPIYHYRVWQNGATSDEREGEPVAWSSDGSKLYVLHNVRDEKSGTGAPAAEDYIGWLEIFSMPDLESLRQYPDTKIDDRSLSLDPSDQYLLYETIGDTSDTEYAHVLNLTDASEKMFDVVQRSFTWNDEQQVVVAPQLHDPLTSYDGHGNPTYMKPVHGVATLYDVKSNPVGTWDDVGQYTESSSDAAVVVLYDNQFLGSFPFVTAFRDGLRITPEALPVDGYLATCDASAAPMARAVTAECQLQQPSGNSSTGMTAIYSLAN